MPADSNFEAAFVEIPIPVERIVREIRHREGGKLELFPGIIPAQCALQIARTWDGGQSDLIRSTKRITDANGLVHEWHTHFLGSDLLPGLARGATTPQLFQAQFPVDLFSVGDLLTNLKVFRDSRDSIDCHIALEPDKDPEPFTIRFKYFSATAQIVYVDAQKRFFAELEIHQGGHVSRTSGYEIFDVVVPIDPNLFLWENAVALAPEGSEESLAFGEHPILARRIDQHAEPCALVEWAR